MWGGGGLPGLALPRRALLNPGPWDSGDVLRPLSAKPSACSLPPRPMWEGTCSHWASAPMSSSSWRIGVHRSEWCAGPDGVCHLWRLHRIFRGVKP